MRPSTVQMGCDFWAGDYVNSGHAIQVDRGYSKPLQGRHIYYCSLSLQTLQHAGPLCLPEVSSPSWSFAGSAGMVELLTQEPHHGLGAWNSALGSQLTS